MDDEPRCVCDQGYQPVRLECRPDACRLEDCGGHGACVEEGGDLACVCDPGYGAVGMILTPAQWYSLNVRGLTDEEGGDLRSPFRLSFATAPASGTAETEPNDDSLTASDTIRSSEVFTFTGTSEIAGAVDTYIVTAEAGDRLGATVFAERGALSTGDYLLRLTASDGTTVINENNSSFGLDPFIDHVFEVAGTYYLVVVGGELDEAYEFVGCLESR
jgi:hypothetical protein